MRSARDPAGAVAFRRSRLGGALMLGFGWLCAHALLTLVLIAPGPAGTAVLVVLSLPALAMALVGLRALVSTRPLLTVGGEGLWIGGAGLLPWSAVRAFRLARGRFEVALDDPPRAGLPPATRLLSRLGSRRGRRITLGPGRVAGGLTAVRDACRERRPDLEERA